MLIGKIHKGSGLGDQLFSYIITRVIALDKGYEFGFVGAEFFKGKDFMNLDWGKSVPYSYFIEEPSGKLSLDKEGIFNVFEINKPYYDPEVNFVEDGTVIDGYGSQDERYFEHKLEQIKEWLKIQPFFMSDDLCVINFRGGEFTAFPDLFLPKEYWDKAIRLMLVKNPDMKFEVHTDDPITAKTFFPDYPIISGIDLNWRSVRYAKHAIIANSAFGIIPRLLSGEDTIAPRYWARRNIKEWSMPSNYYKGFTYV